MARQTQTGYTGQRASTAQQNDIAFSHFGVMHTGKQGRGSLFSALVINVTLLVVALILTAAAKKVSEAHKITMLTAPSTPPPKPEPKPELPRPKPLPKPPVIPPTPPKIKIPETKLPDVPKPPEVKMETPKPIVLQPAPPKLVQPPPAPVKVNLGHAQAASVVNNSTHPSAVALGQTNNPIAPMTGPATSPVNLGQRGMAGMPPGSGMGPPSTKVNLGSGSPNGTLGGRDNAAQPVQGVKLGVAGGTGPLNSTGRVAGPVNLGQAAPPPMPKPAAPTTVSGATPPKVLYKPKPEYTDEARKLHLEGTVYVKVRVTASGAVQVLGVSSGLGHGLDEAAVRVVEAMKFSPAMQNGQPVDWSGVVNVGFQML